MELAWVAWEGSRKLLEGANDITIVGEASNGVECAKMLAKLKPDILLLDLRMPEKDGLSVLEEFNFDSTSTRVIVLTAAEDDRDVLVLRNPSSIDRSTMIKLRFGSDVRGLVDTAHHV
jgi:DNA-binding NarL/FixJ family response regulator